ncbi:hypothetical protein BDCR2A_01960 [Borrelia duttonii CR2A]|uniref:Variable outer membrane protein n=1 Tax=Borrelia duttonii CR2A TaxID=1432657 RepID=W6TVS2_9SPIR|nr:hypothetical protein BDCR2A_01960 [Borrelia duttonii CR2A]
MLTFLYASLIESQIKNIKKNKEARRMNIEKKGEGKVRVIILMMVMMGCNSGGGIKEGEEGGKQGREMGV